jgi:hypothetical protein
MATLSTGVWKGRHMSKLDLIERFNQQWSDLYATLSA